jgi:hypothetical protein
MFGNVARYNGDARSTDARCGASDMMEFVLADGD